MILGYLFCVGVRGFIVCEQPRDGDRRFFFSVGDTTLNVWGKRVVWGYFGTLLFCYRVFVGAILIFAMPRFDAFRGLVGVFVYC